MSGDTLTLLNRAPCGVRAQVDFQRTCEWCRMLFYPKLRLRTSKAVEHQRPELHPLISDLLKWTSCFLPRYKTGPLASPLTSLDDLKEAAVIRVSEAEEGGKTLTLKSRKETTERVGPRPPAKVYSVEGLLLLFGVILMSHDQFF